MYKTDCIIVRNDKANKDLFEYCKQNCMEAKLFKNSVIFRLRQLLTARNKEDKDLSDNEIQVLNEFEAVKDSQFAKYYKDLRSSGFPNYNLMDVVFKLSSNPDYYNDNPMQTTQNILKECLNDFKSYNKAKKEYLKNPSRFTGKPKLPNYIKVDEISFDITNQDAVVYKRDDGTFYLKLPKTKAVLDLGKREVSKLKEVTITPYYDTYKVCIVSEVDINESHDLDESKIIGIDLGVNNFLTISNNCGLNPFIINGKILKSQNQYVNKTTAELKSMLPEGVYSSKRLEHIYKYRTNYMNDAMHKISAYVVSYCLANHIGTVVVGKNNSWKQKANMGAKNNQNFCFLPHSVFISKLQYKCGMYGINLIINEESYTSKASFLDNDAIPTYKKDDEENHVFSGNRIHRGLYISKDGIKINADVNGASNIIKKAVSTAFDNVEDLSYLYSTRIERISIC
jgi:putative transposase